MKKFLAAPALGLFTSLGTLICCVLPAIFVTLGAGATLASVLTAVPQLIWLSEHKAWVFGLSGLCIALAGIVRYQQRNAPCPADPEQARLCQNMRTLSLWMLAGSGVIWAIGFSFAFILPRLI